MENLELITLVDEAVNAQKPQRDGVPFRFFQLDRELSNVSVISKSSSVLSGGDLEIYEAASSDRFNTSSMMCRSFGTNHSKIKPQFSGDNLITSEEVEIQSLRHSPSHLEGSESHSEPADVHHMIPIKVRKTLLSRFSYYCCASHFRRRVTADVPPENAELQTPVVGFTLFLRRR